MRCDELNRWLDEGMPEAGAEAARAAAARAHAGTCAACGRALAAAAAIERSLAAEPPSPPRGGDRFVADVLAAMAAPAATASRGTPAPGWRRLAWGLVTEPTFVAGAATLAAILLIPGFARERAVEWLSLGASAAAHVATAEFAQAMESWLGASSAVGGLDPFSSAAIAACLAGLGIWAGISAVHALDGALRQGMGRRR